MNYYEVVSILPRSLASLFYGIPKWLEIKIVEPSSIYKLIYKAERAGIKKEWLNKFRFHKETLSTIMLIYFLNKYFINSKEMINGTLSILKELGIEEFRIGSTSFHEGSEIVEFVQEFSEKIPELFVKDKLISHYINKNYASEIINDYRTDYADEDLQF